MRFLSVAVQVLRALEQILGQVFTRRQFFKASAWTVGAIMFASKSSAQPIAEPPLISEEGASIAMILEAFPITVSHASGVELSRDRTRLLIAFIQPSTKDKVRVLLMSTGMVLEESDEKPIGASSRPKKKINHTNRRFWVRSSSGGHINSKNVTDLEKASQGTLKWISAVYRFPKTEGQSGLVSPLPSVLLIKPASDIKAQALAQTLAQFQLKEVQDISKFLVGYRYFVIETPLKTTVFPLWKGLSEKQYKLVVQEVHLDFTPLVVPTAAFVPTDDYYRNPPSQWNLHKIQAEDGWNIFNPPVLGDNVVVAVVDDGCELSHPDLQGAFFTVSGAPSPGAKFDFEVVEITEGSQGPDVDHGTSCVGIIAARYNCIGVAGLAGRCRIMPLSIVGWEDTTVPAAITYAAEKGAHVISISLWANVTTGDFYNTPAMNENIDAAFKKNVVLCAATGNNNSWDIYHPAAHRSVIACGASNTNDRRCDSTDWGSGGSNYGNALSVAAPGVDIRTTAGGSLYALAFLGTSASTPHVAALAALLLSKYPNLTNKQVQRIIERTADKVPDPALYTTPKLNGDWFNEMGYGRINVLRALELPPSDFADVRVQDYPGDTGAEPSTPPGDDFWSLSDIVVSPTDTVNSANFDASVAQGNQVKQMQQNFLYVRVTNNGPRPAENVVVSVRIAPWVGTQFVYPDDWHDPALSTPTLLQGISNPLSSGETAIAKFSISLDQVQELWDWTGMGWHPCVLAEVTADNDYGLGSPPLTAGAHAMLRNNLAHRNLSVIPVQPIARVKFPILVGNRGNEEAIMEVLIELGLLSKDLPIVVTLDDPPEPFPSPRPFPYRGKLTANPGKVVVDGGKVFSRDDKRFVETSAAKTLIRMETEPRQLYLLTLGASIPDKAQTGQRYELKVSQRNQKGQTVGGATVIYQVA